MDRREQRLGEARHVPVQDLRLAAIGIASVRVDRAEDGVHREAVHEGAGAIIDRLTADRDIVGVHHPVDEADAEPACDKVALQADHPVEQCQMRVGRLGKLGKMAAHGIVRQLRDMVGAEMRGEELKGADADMAARDARQHGAGVRLLALDAIAGGHRGERARRCDAHRRHRLGHEELA